MNKKVSIALIYMGICTVLAIVQNMLVSFWYKPEMEQLLKSVGMMMPTMFLSAFLTEWIWNDNARWNYFQRVFFRILMFTLFMMAVRTVVDVLWDALEKENTYGSDRNLEWIQNFFYTFHYAFLSACVYYVVRLLFNENHKPQKPERFNSEVIDK